MKRKWNIFLILNVVEQITFTASFGIELYRITKPFRNFSISTWALMLMVFMSVVMYYNCIRNISLSKAIVNDTKSTQISQNTTRILTALFSLDIFLLAYGLFQGYETFISGFNWYNLLQKIAYTFQVITVVIGAYIVYHQSALTNLIIFKTNKATNNSIGEIGK